MSRGRFGRLVAALAVAGATAALPGSAAAGPLRVVTTTTDLRALVEAVGGDRVTVESLLGGAQPPHSFPARPAHLLALRRADLVVRIGADHDAWVGRLLGQAGNPRLAAGQPGHVDTSRGIELLDPGPSAAAAGGHVHAFGNTHYWLDPANARPMTAAIAAGLTAVAPAEGPTFATRRTAFLERVDQGLRRWTAALAPYRGARVVAVHDSFPYLAERFGLVIAATIEREPGVAPPPAHLARVAEAMRRHGIRLVLSESWLPDDLAGRLAAQTGATVVKLPTSVDSAPHTGDLIALFDQIIQRLAAGLQAAAEPAR